MNLGTGLILCGVLFLLVSCSGYSVKMPDTLETINGSCIVIPCTFTSKDLHVKSPATGVWRKGSQWFTDGVDVFNSSKSQNKLHGEILGDLIQHNCTSVLYGFTKDYEDNYFFRLESEVKLTFPQHVSIKVNDALPKPRLTLPQSFQEGVLTTMTCAVASKALCFKDPPTLIWSPKVNESGVILQIHADGTNEVISVLSFMPSHSHNGLSISCVVKQKGAASVQETVLLSVLYKPNNLSVSMNPAQFEVGSPITLSCLGTSNPPIDNYRWFRNASGYLEEMEWTSQNFTFNATHSASGVYHCEGGNAVGASNSSWLQLVVPDSLQVNQFKPEWWLLITGGFTGIIFCVLGAALFHRRKNPQTQQQNKKDHDLKGREVDSDMYINVTEETLRRAAGEAEPSDSVYCNQFQPDKNRANSHDCVSQMDDAIYANY